MRPLLTRIPPSILTGTIALLGSLGLLIACQNLPQSAHQVERQVDSPLDSQLESGLASPEESLSPQETAKLARQQVSIASLRPPTGTAPVQSNGEPIVLRGTITQVAPLLTGVAYELTDETDKIWVVSDRASLDWSDNLDQLGNQSFWVTGTPQYQSIPAGGQEWGETYLQELARFPATE